MTFGTQIFELSVNSEIKVFMDTFKKDILFWIYVKIRYGHFHRSIILAKLRKLKRVAHVLCAPCALGFKKRRKSTEA